MITNHVVASRSRWGYDPVPLLFPTRLSSDLCGSPSQQVKELQDKYSATIKTGITGEAAGVSVTTMNEFLKEWDPVGQSEQDLRWIIGDPSGKTLVYRFDSGLGGWEYTFRIERGRVVAVSKRSLN